MKSLHIRRFFSIGFSLIFSRGNRQIQNTNSCPSDCATDKNGQELNVVICGGGPGGFLTSILLNNIGIKSTILEKSEKLDEWNSRSYTIILNSRGKQALEQGGCLKQVMKAGIARKYIYVIDGQTGEKQVIPSESTGIALSRPTLVRTLEKIASKLPRVTIKRDAKVSKIFIDSNSGQPLVHLEDGKVVSATHVIGADGIGSKVRASFPFLNSQASVETCSGFSVTMQNPSMPKGWKVDGTYLIKPPDFPNFYIIASPRPSGHMGVTIVCREQMIDRYPWLAPPADKLSTIGFNVKSYADLSEKLERMMQEEFPAFYKIINKNTFKSIETNRNVTWLRYKANRGNSYSLRNGRVTLVGDAAHAMTPSKGEGCNTALESAAKLVEIISSMWNKKDDSSSSCTTNILNEAFIIYGSSRPKDVQPLQEMSAASFGNR